PATGAPLARAAAPSIPKPLPTIDNSSRRLSLASMSIQKRELVRAHQNLCEASPAGLLIRPVKKLLRGIPFFLARVPAKQNSITPLDTRVDVACRLLFHPLGKCPRAVLDEIAVEEKQPLNRSAGRGALLGRDGRIGKIEQRQKTFESKPADLFVNRS